MTNTHTHYSLFVGGDYDPRVWFEAERLGVETHGAAPGGAGWSGEDGEEPTLEEVASATGLGLATVERLARMAGWRPGGEESWLGRVRLASEDADEARARLVGVVRAAVAAGAEIKALAEAAGVSRTTIYAWLRDQ